MKALSLFSGIGGLDVAATSAGFTVTAQVEIDTYCRGILKKQAPERWEHAQQFADIRDVTASQVGAVSLIFGGFPCQDISIAGRKAGIQDGNRSGLYYELLRLVRDLRPRAVILENVANIVNNGLGIVSSTLSEIGYDCLWQVTPASDFGAPHRRERWFCVAIRNAASKRLEGNNGRQLANNSITRSDTPQLGNAYPIRRSGYRQRVRGQVATQGHSTHTAKGRITEPGLGRAAHGLSGWMDFAGFPAMMGAEQFNYEPPRMALNTKHRKDRLQALGNAVVPQQAYPFFEAVYRLLSEEKST